MPKLETHTPINLQDRDFALLRGLFESRIMTAGHIAKLYFEAKQEAAKKRLQKLKAAGLIGERKRRVNEASILFLTRKAFKVLHDHGSLSEYPSFSAASLERRAQVSDLTLRHELEVMDVKSSFHVALSRTGQFILVEFSTWPLLHQFEAFRPGYGSAEVLVKPDGFIRIHERERDGGLSEHTFFLELDRSSETQDTLVTRAACYLDYYKSGGFAVRNGANRAAYKDYPFRVLMVFKTAERRNNTAERLLQNNPPIFTQVYLSTLAEVIAGPLDAIWSRPLDYRNATSATPFELGMGGPKRAMGYRRQSEREALVERRIKKHRILTEDVTA
jgi:hypothetical protein